MKVLENTDIIDRSNDTSYIVGTKAFEYHELSKMTEYNYRRLGINISYIKASGFYKKLMKSYKIYQNAPQTRLPKSQLIQPVNLQEVIVNRRSRRNFNGEIPLKVQQIAEILQLSYGATVEFTYEGEKQILRATPSAGALYPLEIYIISRNIESLDKGVYHYRICKHSLELVKNVDEGIFKNLEKKWSFPKEFQCVVVITGVWNRSFIKYSERAYRYLLIETGIVSENMTLISEVQGLNALIMGGWSDDEINELLGIDGINEISLLPICIGACKKNE